MAGYGVDYKLKNIALYPFEHGMDYPSVISPFSRLYLITKGKGWLMLDNHRIALEPGYLYLIPSLVNCSYYFEAGLEHFYIHFTARLQNGLNIYNLYQTDVKVMCSQLDELLFERLLKLNPGLQLPSLNPDVYQKKEWLTVQPNYSSLSYQLESKAIIAQLVSRFIKNEQKFNASDMSRHNLNTILVYIHEHLHERLDLDTLAEMACLSKDHFIRVFKKVLSMAPGEYIVSKRIEKGKLLLLTSNQPIKRIIEETGFKTEAYFSRVFKNHTQLSPTAYRKKQVN